MGSRMASLIKKSGKQRVVIVDLGCGDGGSLAKLVRQIRERSSSVRFELVLIEREVSLLDAAVKRLATILREGESVDGVCCDFAQVGGWIERLPRDPDTLVFAIAAFSLHHLNREGKRRILISLRKATNMIFLCELQADHEFPSLGSKRLIASVRRLYGYLLRDIEASQLSIWERALCRSEFILKEAISILSNEYDQRGDYHMLLSQWEDLFRDTGLSRQKLMSRCFRPPGPLTMIYGLYRANSELF